MRHICPYILSFELVVIEVRVNKINYSGFRLLLWIHIFKNNDWYLLISFNSNQVGYPVLSMGVLPDVRRPGGPRPSHPPGPRHAPEDHRRRGQGGRGYIYYDKKITRFTCFYQVLGGRNRGWRARQLELGLGRWEPMFNLTRDTLELCEKNV